MGNQNYCLAQKQINKLAVPLNELGGGIYGYKCSN